MKLPTYFISCDWGTTNFRLRLVKTDTLKVLSEHKTDQGVKTLFQHFSQQNDFDQTTYYSNYLKEQIQGFPEVHRGNLVISSGMSTANIGLLELPYAGLPFDKTGDSFVRKRISISEHQDILLISGVKSETGMMRGEEVQAIGLEERLRPYEKGILVLPGTHSKHISYRKGRFYALKNYMTGELFDVLGKKSILANSLESAAWDAESEEMFLEGVQLGINGELTASLLMIRARHVVQNKSKKDNSSLLSGLLIGDELSYLKDSDDYVFLAAPDTLFHRYKTALESFMNHEKLVVMNGLVLEKALLTGQRKLLEINAD